MTVLTSEPEASPTCCASGSPRASTPACGGFVCAAPDIATVRQLAPRRLLVTPGIRPEGAPVDDQGRVATPAARRSPRGPTCSSSAGP